MTRPLVSIITPTYNHERFIGSSIESVLAQGYHDWEMIIINDGSTDRTADVATSYHDPRIRYFHQKNRGIWRLAETYNFALEQARGDFIAVLEGDDCWPNNRLETQVPLLENSDSVLCYGSFLRIDESGRLLDCDSVHSSGQIVKQSSIAVLRELLKGRMTVMPVTSLINRHFLESIGGFQQPAYYPAVEHPTWLNLTQQGPFLYVDTPMGYWRRHIGQATGKRGPELRTGQLKYNIEFFKRLNVEKQRKVGIDVSQLYRLGLSRVAAAHFSKGRYLLMDKDRAGAKRSFLIALRRGGTLTKVKAGMGLLSLTTKIDFERLVALAGRARYR